MLIDTDNPMHNLSELIPLATKQTMQALARDLAQNLSNAVLVPRDFARILPVHWLTLYAFLRKGTGRKTSIFTFEKVKKFLDDALKAGVFPVFASSGLLSKKPALVEQAYEHWVINNTLLGYKHNLTIQER